MSNLIRVYHPTTDEPFDLPEWKANELILNEGWRKQPIDPSAVPAVTSTGEPVVAEVHDWRDNPAAEQVVEEHTVTEA